MNRIAFFGLMLAAAASLAPAVRAQDDRIRPKIDVSGANLKPEYPDRARAAHLQGTVVIAVLVSAYGTPTDVSLEKSSGHPDLDMAAINAVKRWKFVPARYGSDAVADWTAVGIRFEMDKVSDVSVSPDTKISENYRNRIVCRKSTNRTGSHLRAASRCQPLWKWEIEDRRNQAILDDANRRTMGKLER